MCERRLGQLATTGCRTSQFLTAGERLTAAPAERAAEGGESAERGWGEEEEEEGSKARVWRRGVSVSELRSNVKQQHL